MHGGQLRRTDKLGVLVIILRNIDALHLIHEVGHGLCAALIARPFHREGAFGVLCHGVELIVHDPHNRTVLIHQPTFVDDVLVVVGHIAVHWFQLADIFSADEFLVLFCRLDSVHLTEFVVASKETVFLLEPFIDGRQWLSQVVDHVGGLIHIVINGGVARSGLLIIPWHPAVVCEIAFLDFHGRDHIHAVAFGEVWIVLSLLRLFLRFHESLRKRDWLGLVRREIAWSG